MLRSALVAALTAGCRPDSGGPQWESREMRGKPSLLLLAHRLVSPPNSAHAGRDRSATLPADVDSAGRTLASQSTPPANIGSPHSEAAPANHRVHAASWAPTAGHR